MKTASQMGLQTMARVQDFGVIMVSRVLLFQ